MLTTADQAEFDPAQAPCASASRVKHTPRTLKTQHFDAMLGRRPVRMTPLLALHRLDLQQAADAGLLMPSGALLGVMVAKRHAKRAVWRNAIKRQLRESFRLHALPEGGWLIRLRGSIVPWSEQRKHEIRQQADELMQRTLASARKPEAQSGCKPDRKPDRKPEPKPVAKRKGTRASGDGPSGAGHG